MFSHTDFTNNHHLYGLVEFQRAMMAPTNMLARMGVEMFASPFNPLAHSKHGRTMAAGFELLERLTRQYEQPDFHIYDIEINGKTYGVKERIAKRLPFCNLLHFKKDYTKEQPRLLIVAPLSGHFSTLLRGTVRGFLPHFDVYITDWINARDIPLSLGPFDLDDYIDYIIQFLRKLGKGTHVMGVCQPSVPVMAATSILAAEKDEAAPASMILIGGPIDTRKSPTEVNRLAYEKPIEWFEQNVICHVPMNYPGFMRKVYPGFIQLTGFMTMNLDRHLGAHLNLFNHLIEGDGDSAQAHRKFYNEYLAVMDLPAEFYLQTVKTVFKDHSLPLGTMKSRERKVRPETITKTAVLAIEGERDDISGLSQTKAALTLCTNLPDSKKQYYLQKDVGHYGTFNGRRFREQVVPTVCDFVRKHDR
ncbi:MAG: polyhydroxyalkanoate depolymerase [Hyphomicrobiales bacterium]|nr:polyhydroxyalkanoate depolymerase [Hyphomicrobiales bacterium]